MRVVVIGGNGFIGKNLVNYLCKLNYEIIVYDKRKIEEENVDISYIQGDLSDITLLKKIINCEDVIIHLGCTSVPHNSNLCLEGDIENNLLTTSRLLTVCKEKLVRKVIYASSGGSIYGVPSYLPIDEKHPTNPISVYGIHKLTIEKYLAILNRETNIQTISLRIGNPYGTGQKAFTGQGVIPTFLASALQGKTIEVWGNGLAVRDYLYITDLCEVISRCIRYDGKEQIFNIGSGQGTDIKMIIKTIEDVMGIQLNPIYKEAYEVEVNNNILNCNKAKNELQWTSSIELEEGIKMMLANWDVTKLSF